MCDKVLLLQSMTGCYYKVREVSQSVKRYYKVKRNTRLIMTNILFQPISKQPQVCHTI